MQLARCLGRKCLHHAECHRKQEEEPEAHPHRRDAQEAKTRRDRHALPRCLRGQKQPMPVQPQHHQHGQCQGTGAGQCHTPGVGQRQRHDKSRCQRPAQAAGDAMNTVGMAQPRCADLAVEQGVVHGMEHAIASARHDGEKGHHPVARTERETQARRRHQGKPAQQHGPGTEAIHHEARRRLHGAGGDKEHRHQEAQFSVARVQGLLEPGKQGRQHELTEMADAVRHAHEQNHGHILAQDGRFVRGS